jgi:phosphoribosylformimino-5-aminoimidazole carboxamide ribonucleotide (ProFAR) isomerase
MFIPAIDLKGGQVVQLVQGKRLALASDDIDAWVRKFAHYPRVQLIDLDGALETGANDAIVRRICAQLPCRVGGGVRTIARAEALVAAGARQVIVSSALFQNGRIDLAFARALVHAVGIDRVIAAVDSAGGKVVIRGWTEATQPALFKGFTREFGVEWQTLLRFVDLISAATKETSSEFFLMGAFDGNSASVTRLSKRLKSVLNSVYDAPSR